MNSCSDDDDGDVIEPVGPTGSITITDDAQTLTDNTILVNEVTISTDGWLVARKVNADQSFSAVLADTLLQEGTSTNLEIQLDNMNDQNVTLEDGDVIVFVLHQDDGDGQFEYVDESSTADQTIKNAAGSAVTETVVVSQPSVTIEDQSVVNGQIIVQNVSITEPAWVVVYNDAGGTIDETDIIGRTLVSPDSPDNVVVDLDDDFTPTAGQNIYTRIHFDDPADETWTFEDDNTQDVPMTFGFETDNTITVTSVLN